MNKDRSAKNRVSPQSLSKKQKVSLVPEPPKMDLLTVPVVDTQKEARPMTLEEMEDVGKRYHERKRKNKVLLADEGGHGAWQLDRLGFKSAAPAPPSSWENSWEQASLCSLICSFIRIIKTIPPSQGFCEDEMRYCF